MPEKVVQDRIIARVLVVGINGVCDEIEEE
jgi:hypothetical protein